MIRYYEKFVQEDASEEIFPPETIFFDNFNAQNGGVPVDNFLGWINWEGVKVTLNGGAPDLKDLATGGYDTLLTADGLFVCLFSSASDPGPPAGTRITSQNFNWVSGRTYRITFQLAGNNKNAGDIENDVVLNFPNNIGSNYTYTIQREQQWTTYQETFICAVTSPQRFTFGCIDSTVPGAGPLLDNVLLERIA